MEWTGRSGIQASTVSDEQKSYYDDQNEELDYLLLIEVEREDLHYAVFKFYECFEQNAAPLIEGVPEINLDILQLPKKN